MQSDLRTRESSGKPFQGNKQVTCPVEGCATRMKLKRAVTHLCVQSGKARLEGDSLVLVEE